MIEQIGVEFQSDQYVGPSCCGDCGYIDRVGMEYISRCGKLITISYCSLKGKMVDRTGKVCGFEKY
jgi:hypothetical protein